LGVIDLDEHLIVVTTAILALSQTVFPEYHLANSE
jgi:hypothetical protein